MSHDIQPGDVVQKVAGSSQYLRIGTVRRVDALCPKDHSAHGVTAAGLIFNGARTAPNSCQCYDPRNWRKLNDGTDDAELIERIRKCKPMKAPQHA